MAIKFKMFREKLEEEVAKVLVVENDAPGTDMTTGNTQGLGGGGSAIQIPGENKADLGDGSMAPFMIEDENVRRAVNSFISTHLSERAYLNPQEALAHLRTKLNIWIYPSFLSLIVQSLKTLFLLFTLLILNS